VSSRGIRLNSLQDVRRFLARIANELYKKKIETDAARALGYIGSIIISAIKDSDLEERIEKIEKQLSERGGEKNVNKKQN
jgi:hypothetical protein